MSSVRIFAQCVVQVVFDAYLCNNTFIFGHGKDHSRWLLQKTNAIDHKRLTLILIYLIQVFFFFSASRSECETSTNNVYTTHNTISNSRYFTLWYGLVGFGFYSVLRVHGLFDQQSQSHIKRKRQPYFQLFYLQKL